MEGTKLVYIGNLAWTTNSDQLLEFLMRAGGVASAQVQRHEDTKRSKGWGLADFNSPAEALNAIAMLDKSTFHGRQLHLRLDRRMDPPSPTDRNCSVFVGNLAWAVTQDQLMAVFAPYGPVDCSILTNMYGRSKGFAIMRFPSESVAMAAIQAMNGSDLAGRPMECRLDRGGHSARAEGGGPDAGPDHTAGGAGGPTIFVSRLGPSIIDDNSLAALFAHIGPIASARLQKTPSGRSKGWGTVTFRDPNHAAMAVNLMSGHRGLEVHLDRKTGPGSGLA